MSKYVIGNFIYNKRVLVVVKLEHGTHVMDFSEWKRVYGKLHPEHWIKKPERLDKTAI